MRSYIFVKRCHSKKTKKLILANSSSTTKATPNGRWIWYWWLDLWEWSLSWSFGITECIKPIWILWCFVDLLYKWFTDNYYLLYIVKYLDWSTARRWWYRKRATNYTSFIVMSNMFVNNHIDKISISRSCHWSRYWNFQALS